MADFAFAQLARRCRLHKVVDARAAAANLGLGDFDQFQAWNGPQQLPRRLAHALCVRQMTGVLIDDPQVYTKSWSGGFDLRWTADTELFEYICQDNNTAPGLMMKDGQPLHLDLLYIP